MKDINGKKLKNGDTIDIHQTVNGQSLFVVISQSPLDIRYKFDLSRRYEYDKKELLDQCKYSCSVEWEIIGSINESSCHKGLDSEFNPIGRCCCNCVYRAKSMKVVDPSKFACVAEYSLTGNLQFLPISEHGMCEMHEFKK